MHRLGRSLFVAWVVGVALGGCEKDELVVLERPALEPAASGSPSAGGAAALESDAGKGEGGRSRRDAGASDDGQSGSGGSDLTETRLLPDLVLDTAYLLETTAQDFIEIDDGCLVNEACVTGLGTRRVVRFGTRTGNIGTADLRIGSPNSENPLWSYDSCSDAYNLHGYAKYDLLAEPSGADVVLGAKNGFCMRDSEVWDESLVQKDCERYDCNDQGISVGCADNYVAGLKCQWVDITGVANGDYRIRVQINAERNVEELDYANNIGFILIRITSDDVFVRR